MKLVKVCHLQKDLERMKTLKRTSLMDKSCTSCMNINFDIGEFCLLWYNYLPELTKVATDTGDFFVRRIV